MSQSTEDLLAQRKTTHGEYSEHARCTQAIMVALQRERGWETLPDIVKESLHMFAHKMGRVVTGNWAVADHYADIAGYATLIVQRLEDGKGLREGHRPVDLLNRLARDLVERVQPHSIMESKRDNVGHPSELSSRYLTPADVGRKALRRDGQQCEIHNYRYDPATEITDFIVRRSDGAMYDVGRDGFMVGKDTPNAADIRQVILG